MIILGLLKLTYNKWRLRKYTAVAENKAAVRREMQHTVSVKRGRSQRQKIPFGVRALESGIEVDGVWISGTNTPSTMPGSPNIAAMKPQPAHKDYSPEASSSASETSRIEVPQPVHGYSVTNHSSGISNRVSAPVDRPVSSEAQHKKPHPSEHQSLGRPTYQPRRSSHLRFSNSLDAENSEALAALEGRTRAADRKGKRPEGKYNSLTQKRFNANSGTAQDLTPQERNIVTQHRGLAILRAHPAARTTMMCTSRSNLDGPRTATFIPALANPHKLVPLTLTIPKDTSPKHTSPLSSILLQAIPNHIWTKWVDCTSEIEKAG